MQVTYQKKEEADHQRILPQSILEMLAEPTFWSLYLGLQCMISLQLTT